MKPTDFDENFWFSDPESMGRIIYEKYDLNDFYHAELSQTLYQRVFCQPRNLLIPNLEINKQQLLKHSF